MKNCSLKEKRNIARSHNSYCSVCMMLQLPLLLLLLLLQLLGLTLCAVTLNVNEARTVCVAKCLRTFKSQVTGRLADIIVADPRAINRECNNRPAVGGRTGDLFDRRDRTAAGVCQSCSYACNHYLTQPYSRHSNCISFCLETGSNNGFDQAACRKSCAALERMMSSGKAVSDSEAATAPQPPDIPAAPRARRPHGKVTPHRVPLNSLVELDWSDYNVTAASADPIVFLSQFRSWQQNEDEEAQEADESQKPRSGESSSQWNDLAITTYTELLVEDLASGSWYQFRLAAVSPFGMRGYSQASEPFLQRSPRRPGGVRGLQEGISRLQEDRVDVQIVWQQPKRLPGGESEAIDTYKIKWVEMLGIDRQSDIVKSQSISGTQTEFFIPNLKLATTYKVTVSAIVVYGANQQLKSRRTIYVVTMQLPTLRRHSNKPSPGNKSGKGQVSSGPQATNDSPTQLQQQKLMIEPAHTADCSCRDRPTTPLVAKQPYYENGDLRLLLLWPRSTFENGPSAELVNTYTIRWSQRVCIESDAVDQGTRQTVVHNTLMMNITGLRFNCHYALQFNGLSKSGRVAFTWNTCFCTASCKETKIKGHKLPPCPKTEGNTIPQPPDRLRVAQLLRVTSTPSDGESAGSAAVRLSWAAPAYPHLRAILGFRVKWGPRIHEEVHPDAYSAGGLLPRMNEAQAITSVVDMRERHLLLHSLLPATVYIVSVQTLSVFGDSRPALTHFTTPGSLASQAGISSSGFSSPSAALEDAQLDSSRREVQKYFVDSGVSRAGSAARAACAPLVWLACVIFTGFISRKS